MTYVDLIDRVLLLGRLQAARNNTAYWKEVARETEATLDLVRRSRNDLREATLGASREIERLHEEKAELESHIADLDREVSDLNYKLQKALTGAA